MFEKAQKKPDDEAKKRKPLLGNIPRRTLSLSAKFAISQNANNSKKNKPNKEFESRMKGLYEKGKKRGFRYSVIGISYCIITVIIVLSLGYYLTKEIKEITRQVYDADLTPLEAILDPGNKICDLNYCCLASLKRIHKHDYEIYDREKRCQEGYERKSLECENSLAWCQPTENTMDINIEKINDIKITNPSSVNDI